MVNGTGIVKQIVGADSPETAYVVEDYPYGFRLRTVLRAWIEHNDRYGERAVTQTKNPKTGAWNKIKAGTYTAISVLGTDGHGHLCFDGLGNYRSEDEITAFVAKYQLNEVQRKEAETLLIIARAGKHVKVTVRTLEPGETWPDRTEQDKKFREDFKQVANYEAAQIKLENKPGLPAGPGTGP